MPSAETHFGYRQVATGDKAPLVASTFASVAPNYDLMNDLMSLGVHRLWRLAALQLAAPREGHKILDLAAGTGNMTTLLCRRVGAKGCVISTDINRAMLSLGRDRLLDNGPCGRASFVQCDAENLPFPDKYFDRVVVAFGLRNMTNIPLALKSMRRILKRGGRAVILEFSRPKKALSPIYDFWSFYIIPKIGKLIAKDEGSYQYLVESIRMHPDQESLQKMMEEAGFTRCEYFNLSGGVVAAHRGCRI